MSSTPNDAPLIAIDARPLYKQHDGMSRYLWELVDALGRRDDLRLLLIAHRPLAARTLPPGVELLIDDAWARLPGTLWFAWRFAGLARRAGASAVWGPQQVLPPWGLRGLRSLLTLHDLVFLRYPQTMQAHNRLVSALLLRRSLRRAQQVVCISRFTRQELQQLCPGWVPAQRQHVIHNARTALPAAEPLPGLPPQYLFCLGSLEPRKNLLRVVDCLALLRAELPELKLVLAGGAAWGGSALERRIAELGLQQSVVFAGRLSDGQIRSALAGCAAAVFASRYEGFGLPVLEAAGIAPRQLLNDIPVLREVAELLPPSALAFAPFDEPERAAQVALQLLRQPPQPGDAATVRGWELAAGEYAALLRDGAPS